jgi:F-type H+-transporting ATPase subunit b
MEILRQLGELFLGAVPTVIVVLLFYFFLRWAFFNPIQKAMADRSARIEGARAEAVKVEAQAKQEMDTYHEALRRARAQIYAEQEAARQRALDERAEVLKAAHTHAREQVAEAKKAIAANLEAARADLVRQTPALANEIARVILERPSRLRGGAAR